METPRNDQRIDRIRILDSAYRPKLMWIELKINDKKKKEILLLFLIYSNDLNIKRERLGVLPARVDMQNSSKRQRPWSSLLL